MPCSHIHINVLSSLPNSTVQGKRHCAGAAVSASQSNSTQSTVDVLSMLSPTGLFHSPSLTEQPQTFVPLPSWPTVIIIIMLAVNITWSSPTTVHKFTTLVFLLLNYVNSLPSHVLSTTALFIFAIFSNNYFKSSREVSVLFGVTEMHWTTWICNRIYWNRSDNAMNQRITGQFSV